MHCLILRFKVCTLTLSCLLLTCTAWAQTILPLPTASQLPVPHLHCIFQDSEGFMWYGTAGGGLCRDNGYQVDVFRSGIESPDLLPNNNVRCIAEDALGDIWFGTPSGTCILKKQTGDIVSAPHLSATGIGSLLLDKDGYMWVSDGTGIHRFTPDGALDYEQAFYETGTLYEDNKGDIWFAAWNQKIWRFTAGTDTFERQLWDSAIKPYEMVEARGEEGFWVSTEGSGIVFYCPETGEIISQPATLGSPGKQRVASLLMDRRDGTLWAATYDGLYAYRAEGTSLRAVPTGTDSGFKLIESLWQDAHDNIFVAGSYPPTFVITSPNPRIQRWTHTLLSADGTPPSPLLAHSCTMDGPRVWVRQMRHAPTGLLLFEMPSDEVSWSDQARESSPTLLADLGSRFSCPLPDTNGSGIWIVKDNNHVVHLRWGGSEGVVEEDCAQLPHTICHLQSMPDGNLLIGTMRGVYTYSPGSSQLTCLHEAGHMTLASCATHDGSIFFSINLEGPPVRIDVEGEKHSLSGLLPNEQITLFAEATDGTLWAASTLGGIYSLTPGIDTLSAHPFLTNLLDGASAIGLHADRTGHLWLLTPTRLYEVNPATQGFCCYRNDDPQIDISLFEGINACDATHVLLSGAGAVCCIANNEDLDRRQGARSNDPKTPLLTAVSIGGQRTIVPSTVNEVSVPANGGAVTLMVSTLEGLYAGHISFAYRPAGDEGADWQYLPEGDNRITLGVLTAGTHRVQVKATDALGCWQDAIATFTIRRARLWWQTPWAIALAIVLVLALVTVLFATNGRIRRLLSLIKLRDRLSIQTIAINPTDVSKATAHEDLLRRARDLAIEHVADMGYSTDQFARDLCMSRVQLYRTLSTLTGQPPGEFLRDIRLKQAAQLLINHPEMSIGDVATATGFSSSSYFSKSFRAKFEQLPTDYRKMKGEE